MSVVVKAKNLEKQTPIVNRRVVIVALLFFAASVAGWFLLRGSNLTNVSESASRSTARLKPNSQPNFEATVTNSAAAPASLPVGMVFIPGGEFSMGSLDPTEMVCGGDQPMDDARPLHRTYVDAFFMDATEVTNEEFEQFVTATGYVTIAERKPTREEFPTVPEENLVAGSAVFSPAPVPVPLDDHYRWWSYVPGANWRHPTGPTSDLKGREKYPAVQIAYDDAAAYAKWAGKRLPTEAEFEFAARGGLTGKPYAWGDELKPDGKFAANIYQGKFPVKDADLGEDGFKGLAPVAQFRPNGYGLYDVAGNVWEWTSDWYSSRHPMVKSCCGAANGELLKMQSCDPQMPNIPIPRRVIKGGSFLCAPNYCRRYRPAARMAQAIDTSVCHLGLRLIVRKENTKSSHGGIL